MKTHLLSVLVATSITTAIWQAAAQRGEPITDKSVTRVTMLGSDESLKWSQEAEALVIECPHHMPCAHAVTFKIDFGE